MVKRIHTLLTGLWVEEDHSCKISMDIMSYSVSYDRQRLLFVGRDQEIVFTEYAHQKLSIEMKKLIETAGQGVS